MLIVFILTLASTAEAEVCDYECGGVQPIMDCSYVTIGCTDFKILPGYDFYYCIYRNPGYILVLFKRPVDTFWNVLGGYQDTSAGRDFMYMRMIQVAKDTAHWWCPEVEECIKSISLPLQIARDTANVWCPVPEEITLPMTVHQCAPEFKITPPYYDKTSNSICTSGCALGAITMVLNYYLNKAGLPMVDIVSLNEWLNLNGGYFDKPKTPQFEGWLIWDTIDVYPDSPIRYDGIKSDEDLDIATKTAMLNSELREGRPVILRVWNPQTGNKHFVVATGISGTTWKIVDPGYSDAKTTLAERYNNTFYGIRVYKPRQ